MFPETPDPDSPPAWIGRLKEAKYISLSGVEFDFLYLDLSSYVQIKSSSFTNVDGDGAYIQHNGLGGMRFPMLMVFSGSDNDDKARTALTALTERGEGTLFHPVFGRIDVVPTGEIEQINAFVTAANQTSLSVELLETTGLLIDNSPSFPSVLDAYLENSANVFNDNFVLEDIAEEVSAKNKFLERVGQIKNTLEKVSAGVTKTQADLDDSFDSINSTIDVMIKDPLMLARQVQNLILSPARELSLIKDKIQAYYNLALDILGITPKSDLYDNNSKNDFLIDSLISGAVISAIAQVTQNNDFELKKELVDAQDKISGLTSDYITWSDSGSAIVGASNNSSDWQDLYDVSYLTIASITKQITEAKTEIRITTDVERATASWCFELYGSIKNDYLWYFQKTNNWGGDEILTLPAMTELVYYV